MKRSSVIGNFLKELNPDLVNLEQHFNTLSVKPLRVRCPHCKRCVVNLKRHQTTDVCLFAQEETRRRSKKFDKKAWLKQHLRKKTKCSLCGSVVVRHMLKRHQATNKCITLALGRLNLTPPSRSR